MEIREIRRRNLELLIENYGGQAKLAERVGVAAGMFSNIVTEARNMGHALARKIEKALKLEKGWMDQIQTTVDPLKAQLIYFYEHLSEEGRDALLGRANAIYANERPADKYANPYGAVNPEPADPKKHEKQ